MSSYRYCETTLKPVYLTLLGWINRWIPDLEAADIAATVMGKWMFQASGGQRTQFGPYKQLYQDAEMHMRWWGQANGYDIPFGVWRTVPLPTQDQLCTLARVYSIFYMAAEHGQVSITERQLAIRCFTLGRFDSSQAWSMPSELAELGAMTDILDRTLYALNNHSCSTFDSCQEFSDLWDFEDKRGEWWLKDFRFHSREYVHVRD